MPFTRELCRRRRAASEVMTTLTFEFEALISLARELPVMMSASEGGHGKADVVRKVALI